MGIGKGSSAPPSGSNPGDVAAKQQQSNVQTATSQAFLNNTNQVTPYGNLKYDVTGSQHDAAGNWIPQFTATQTLSPEQQKLYDTRTAVEQGTYDLAKDYTSRIGEATAKPFSYDGMPAAPTYDEAARIAARDRIIARDQPQMDRARESMITRLSNQGLAPGSEAWRAEQEAFNRGQNDYRLGADVQAGNEAGRIFGLQGDSRTRAIQEAATLRSQPINEVAALLGTGSVQNPTFVNTPQSQVMPTDVSGIYANADARNLSAWQQQNAQQQSQQNALMSGIFGLGGAALGGWGMGGFKGIR